MIIPTSREDWESLTEDQLDGYSDQQLKDALREHFGLKSHIYFMSVGKKKEFILNSDSRPALLKESEDRQSEHKARAHEHRGKGPVSELIAERSEGRKYTFEGVQRYPNGFTDPFSDRRGKIAYVIKDEVDGERFPTQKATSKRLTELKRLKGFDERISIKKQKTAHKVGLKTVEDVIAGGDPEVQEAVKEITAVDDAPFDSDSGSSLDDILNSIPQ